MQKSGQTWWYHSYATNLSRKRQGCFESTMQFLSEALGPGRQARFSFVGGWTHPSEKYVRQIGHLPQVGVKIKKLFETSSWFGCHFHIHHNSSKLPWMFLFEWRLWWNKHPSELGDDSVSTEDSWWLHGYVDFVKQFSGAKEWTSVKGIFSFTLW